MSIQNRDEIKSQLIEGLKHTKKILKNKKGKVNRDLIFTIGEKQFLITIGAGSRRFGRLNTECFNHEFGVERDQMIKKFLDAPIQSGDRGSNLNMGVVNAKAGYHSYSISMPSPNPKRFHMKDLGLLISDATSYVQKHQGYAYDRERERSFTESLVDRVQKYLDDDYLDNCYAKNILFYDIYYSHMKKIIDNGWGEELLTDVGKKRIFKNLIENLSWQSRGFSDDATKFDIDEHYRIESVMFRRFFSDGRYLRNLEYVGVIPPAIKGTAWGDGQYTSYEKFVWTKVEEKSDSLSDSLKEVA